MGQRQALNIRLCAGLASRTITLDNYGRKKLGKTKDSLKLRYVRVFYCSRALEWLNIRAILLEMLAYFGLSEQISLDNIAFSWTYEQNLSYRFYKPSDVFEKFSFVNLLDAQISCICQSAKRLKPFLDSGTSNDCLDTQSHNVHVRTTDLNIIQHPFLRSALKLGLNHIPLQPTLFHAVIKVVLDVLKQIFETCQLHNYGLDWQTASQFLQDLCLSRLRSAARANKFGFKRTDRALFENAAVMNELKWLVSYLYISGVDKACNNACFLCIKHIRLQAYKRLMGDDFSPCMTNERWSLPTAVLDAVLEDLRIILPEIPPPFNSLPFLMATFKVHKQSYRWLTNAFRTVYSNIAVLLTLTTVQILEKIKAWCLKKREAYRNFLRVETSIFWIIDSILQFTLNLPTQIHDIYVADVTRCYECIPLEGPDNLFDALTFTINIGFQEADAQHQKASNSLWVKITPDGTPQKAKWSTIPPKSAGWVHLPKHRLLGLHSWLIRNCFVILGDRVWRQTKGIPMGFSCSPLWCNLYLLSYEIKFIQRLAKLGRTDLLSKFQHAFRYIDDICWLNVTTPMTFLCPSQPRTPNNPFWIYPLDILEIKTEVQRYADNDPSRGISAHFMNAQVVIKSDNSGQYMLSKYDKRRALPFPYTQFIKFASNRPIKQSYNIVISQVLPILYISNTDDAALIEIDSLIQTMVSNGFRQQRITNRIIDWLRSGHFPEIQVDALSIARKLSTCQRFSLASQSILDT